MQHRQVIAAIPVVSASEQIAVVGENSFPARRIVAMTSTVRQVLMLKFKDSITPEQQATLIEKYAALTNSIPALKGFEWGTDLSQDNLHQGYTHVFIATFESAEARHEYLVHPVHQAFAQELHAAVENIIIFPFPTTVTLKAAF